MFSTKSTFFSLLSLLAVLTGITMAAPAPAFVRFRRQADAAQSSQTLDPSQIMQSLLQDGQSGTVDPGQVRSLTSGNNFINFCDTQNIDITNGKQIAGGSCNPTPMGRIIAADKIPSCKFLFPPNNDNSLTENQPFTIKLKIQNMQTGFFANPTTNYYGAPQTVNDQGLLIGHSHVVVEPLPSLGSTQPLDPTKFAFFKGLNIAAADGILSADVTKGLPAGFYRLTSINSATTHQPALVAIAQHGHIDDGVYFEVKAAGAVKDVSSSAASASATASASSGADSSAASASASATSSADSSASSAAASGDNNGASASSTAAPAETSAADSGNGKGGNNNDASASSSAAPAETSSADGNGKDNNNGKGDNNASATSTAAPTETSAAAGGNDNGNGNGNGKGNGKGGDNASATSSAAATESSAAAGGNDNGKGQDGNGNGKGGDNASATSSAAPTETSPAGDNNGGGKGGKGDASSSAEASSTSSADPSATSASASNKSSKGSKGKN